MAVRTAVTRHPTLTCSSSTWRFGKWLGSPSCFPLTSTPSLKEAGWPQWPNKAYLLNGPAVLMAVLLSVSFLPEIHYLLYPWEAPMESLRMHPFSIFLATPNFHKQPEVILPG